MKLSVSSRLFGIVVLGMMGSAHAQLEVTSSGNDCGQIESLRKAGNLGEARNKAQACIDELNNELAAAAGNAFPADVAGWKRGKVEQNQALGVNNVSTTYMKNNHTAQGSDRRRQGRE